MPRVGRGGGGVFCIWCCSWRHFPWEASSVLREERTQIPLGEERRAPGMAGSRVTEQLQNVVPRVPVHNPSQEQEGKHCSCRGVQCP